MDIQAIGIGVQQLSNANALDVDEGVRDELERLSKTFPPGLKYQIAFDTTTAVGESIREVIKTLVEAIIIVIIVIFLFLQTWRSTLIPAITIPVSLVGTFAFVKLFGFSINTLTLFGITLATGLVVDDAIVVIENVERHIEEGIHDARQATEVAMSEVTSAVIATSLVLIAVFVPVSLFPGTTGRLYQQFALTIAFSIALSAFNALTLTPALSALAAAAYRSATQSDLPRIQHCDCADHARLSAAARQTRTPEGASCRSSSSRDLALTYFVYTRVPTSFVPDEDQGYFITLVQAPPGRFAGVHHKGLHRGEPIIAQNPIPQACSRFLDSASAARLRIADLFLQT